MSFWSLTPCCPKCGGRMHGPTYDNRRDLLVYHCLCGYEKTTLPNDRKDKPTMHWKDL